MFLYLSRSELIKAFCSIQNSHSIGSLITTCDSSPARVNILFTSCKRCCSWIRQYSASLLDGPIRQPYDIVGVFFRHISCFTVQGMSIFTWFGGINTGFLSCSCTKGANASILVLSPCTNMMFSGSIFLSKLIIPLASACAEKETLTIFILTQYVFLSITIYLAPLSSLLPSVPSTQYPGIIRVFLSSPHHSLNTCILVPPWSIPGVAKRTQGMSAFSKDLSKGLTFLNSNMLSPFANSSLIFSFCQSINNRQNKFAFSIKPAEKQIAILLSVLFQQLYKSTDNSWALPRAKTGISTLPPFSTVQVISWSIVLSRSRFVSLIVVAQVVSVMSRLGVSLGAEAAPR